MNIDLSQFMGVFFEETEEHLNEMEHLLLDLNVEAPGADELNSIFRAAHSIKGSAGIFGFHAISSVTHVLENLLDQLRNGKQTLRANMVDTFLRAVDQLRALKEAYQNQQEPDLGSANRLCEDLEALTRNEATTAAPADASWGLFETAPDAGPKEEAYGFFDAPETAKPQANASEDSFGFFEDLPEKSGTSPAGEGFGFFEAPPESASAATTPVLVAPAAASPEPAPKPAVPVATTSAAAGAKAAVAAPDAASIRVNVDKIDQIINLVGELVITQAMMNQRTSELDPALFEGMFDTLKLLERNTRDLQDAVMSIRMMPMAFVFNRFPRVVRDMAGRLNKKIELVIEGEDTEMDKGLIEKLADPLTHLVRNSCDHGIEMPELRRERGKSEVGTIRLAAFHRSGHVVVQVVDDGGGLNRKKLLAKAREKGIPVSDEMSDNEVWQLIFAPGFSTAEQVTDISGRGVGMDVVKRNIQELGGKIELSSMEGIGTTTTIRLPLTLAILDGMVVAVGDQRYVIPLVFISESLQPRAEDVRSITGTEKVVMVRGEYIPLAALHEHMGVEPKHTDPTQGLVVMLENEGGKIALLVDELIGQQQVVIKSLESNFRRVEGVSGATIMGDGRVALILNIEDLILLYAKSRGASNAA